jgi:hypothetical protein
MNAKHYTLLLASAFALTSLIAGCGDSGLQRAAVHGRVTIADQPLASGQILFMPVAPNSGPVVSAAIVNGEYKINESQGPVVGRNRVEVRGDRPLGFPVDDEQAFAQRGGAPLPPDPVPAEFNENSTLFLEVAADQDNKYDVPIPFNPQVAGQTSY